MARDFPQRKILGIRWGHQTMCVAFGGKIGDREGVLEIGIMEIPLREEGKKMLGSEKLTIHEYHKREVKEKAKGFVEFGGGGSDVYE